MSDLIYRQDALEAMSRISDSICEAEAVDALCELPEVDAVPVRHGKFMGTEYDGYADGNPVYYEWKCSECGCIFEEDEPMYRYRFCPYCGARMDKE